MQLQLDYVQPNICPRQNTQKPKAEVLQKFRLNELLAVFDALYATTLLLFLEVFGTCQTLAARGARRVQQLVKIHQSRRPQPLGPAPRGPQSVSRMQPMVLHRLAANWYLLARASGKARLYIFNLTGEPRGNKCSDPDGDSLKAASAKEQIPSPPFPVASSALTYSQSFCISFVCYFGIINVYSPEWRIGSVGKDTWYSE